MAHTYPAETCSSGCQAVTTVMQLNVSEHREEDSTAAWTDKRRRGAEDATVPDRQKCVTSVSKQFFKEQ